MSTTTNDIKGSIAAIANRIQERANQLSQERQTLQTLEHDLHQYKKGLEHQQSIHDKLRTKLLVQTRTIHGHELDVLHHKRMIDELHTKISSNEKDHERIEKQIQNNRDQCDRINTNIYVPHLYDSSMHKRKLEQKVQNLKAKRRRREKTLDRMRLETDRNREETVVMEREGRRLKDEIKMMEDVEVREDEEIAAVAMQIRATLAKVRFIYR